MNFFKHKIWVEGLCSFCNEILTFFFFAKLWKLFFMVKSGTDARRHLVLEWSNPISRHFPTSGREPRQVLSSNSTHSQTKKIIIYVKSPRDVLHAVMWAKQSLLIRLWKKKRYLQKEISRGMVKLVGHNPSLLIGERCENAVRCRCANLSGLYLGEYWTCASLGKDEKCVDYAAFASCLPSCFKFEFRSEVDIWSHIWKKKICKGKKNRNRDMDRCKHLVTKGFKLLQATYM